MPGFLLLLLWRRRQQRLSRLSCGLLYLLAAARHAGWWRRGCRRAAACIAPIRSVVRGGCRLLRGTLGAFMASGLRCRASTIEATSLSSAAALSPLPAALPPPNNSPSQPLGDERKKGRGGCDALPPPPPVRPPVPVPTVLCLPEARLNLPDAAAAPGAAVPLTRVLLCAIASAVCMVVSKRGPGSSMLQCLRRYGCKSGQACRTSHV